MIIVKDFHSLIEMNKYIEDNNIKSKDIHYMGNFLNVQGYCLVAYYDEIPKFTLQYEDGIKTGISCCE